MNINQTISKLNEMKLSGMTKSYQDRRTKPDHKDLSFDEFFGLLVDDEYMYRKNKRITRLSKKAKFKISTACLEEIDYRQQRGLQKTSVINLQNTSWLEGHQNILITGPTGVGKTYLACAFGTWACRNGFTASYFRWPRLFGDILASKGAGNYLKHLNKLAKTNLLLIDDFGINTLSDNDKKDFFEIIEDRYMAGSTIITSQLPIKEWHEFIGEPTIADAVMDRLLHVSYKFELKGGSMRKQQKNIE
jgi:DNA replication protein DnaC